MKLKNVLILLSSLAFISCAYASKQTTSLKITSQQMLQKLTPEQSLAKLKAGNLRFVKAKKRARNYAELAKIASTKGQHPFAIVLSCIDSRSIPDLIFDQGLGNMFVARDAGNVVSPTIYASMLFAVKVTGSNLIVVMGHTQCGAVQAACEGKASGFIGDLLAKIQPAVNVVEQQTKYKNCQSMKLVNKIARQNVITQINAILKNVPEFDKLIAEKKLMIVGAMHDIRTGKVEFFNEKGKSV